MRVEAIEQTKKEVEIDEFLFLRKLKSRWRKFGLDLEGVSHEGKERLQIDVNGCWSFVGDQFHMSDHAFREATDEELAIERGFDAIGKAIASLPSGL